ncbi:GTPase HflX [bacterium]|nr:GTPase HflX [bacterium]
MSKTYPTQETKERALLVGIQSPASLFPVDDCLEELALLADTAGVDVILTVKQTLKHIDAGTYIGKGKVQEIADKVVENKIQVVIFDDDLSPAQTKNLEKSIQCKIIDRSALILDIFAKRARTREAKTQVELAQLQYLLPRLTRIWTHLERQAGGGVFTKGPGETQLETDRRLVGQRIAVLKEELKKIESQRKTQRASRDGIFKVALVGYTNVGKSTLLNTLSDAGVFVENRLFATLDATSRKVFLNKDYECIITDTVGFIRKLPHDLVASFRSTLEEVHESDILLHVVDLSNHLFDEQMETVQTVLAELKASEKPTIIVFNKVDRITDDTLLTQMKKRFPGSIYISAARRIGIDKLKNALIAQLQNDYVVRTIKMDASDGKLYSMIRHLTEILHESHKETRLTIKFRARKEDAEKIERYQQKYKDRDKISSTA